MYTYLRKIEIDQKAVVLTFDNGSGVTSTLTTSAAQRIRALILDDLGIDWELGAFGPMAELKPIKQGDDDRPEEWAFSANQP